MRVVKNIVNTGRTIVCTIHQPSIDIFEVYRQHYAQNTNTTGIEDTSIVAHIMHHPLLLKDVRAGI